MKLFNEKNPALHNIKNQPCTLQPCNSANGYYWYREPKLHSSWVWVVAGGTRYPLRVLCCTPPQGAVPHGTLLNPTWYPHTTFSPNTWYIPKCTLHVCFNTLPPLFKGGIENLSFPPPPLWFPLSIGVLHLIHTKTYTPCLFRQPPPPFFKGGIKNRSFFPNSPF